MKASSGKGIFGLRGDKLRSVIFWCLGMLICPLGVALSARSGLGLSMIEAPVYVMHLKLSPFWPWFTFGVSEYCMQGAVLLLLALLLRRFRLRWLLSFGTAVLFGYILDAWRLLVGTEVADSWVLVALFALFGEVLTTFAVSCFFRTWLPQEVWELFVKEFSETKKIRITRVKLFYDLATLAAAIGLMLILLGGFQWSVVGPGTILFTAVNAPLISFWGKLADKIYPLEAKEENNIKPEEKTSSGKN